MTQRHQSILLILMMLITPITSAFEHCVGMSVHFSDIKNTAGQLGSYHTSDLEHEEILKNVLDHNNDHNNINCTVHICGDYDTPSSPVITKIVSSSYYINIDYSSPYDIVLSPDLKPPRPIL